MKINKIAIFVLSAFLLAGCDYGASEVQSENPSQAQEKASYVLKKEIITPEIELTGSVSSGQVANLATKIGGRIKSLNVSTGDVVRAGQLLGELSADEAGVNANTANNDKAKAQETYAAQNNLLEEQIKQGEQGVKTAETALAESKKAKDSIEVVLDEQIKLVESNIATLETSKQNTENIANQRLSSLKSAFDTNLRVALMSIDGAYAFLGDVSDPDSSVNFYNSYKSKLGNQNPQTKSNATNAFNVFQKDYENFHQEYDSYENLQVNGGLEEGKDIMKKIEKYLSNAQDAVRKSYLMLESTTDDNYLSSTTISSLKAKAIEIQGSVEQATLNEDGGGVRGWATSYDEIITQNNAEFSAMDSQINTAKQSLSQAQATKLQQLTSAQSQINIYEQQLAQAKQSLLSARAQREASLLQLQRDLNATSGQQQLSQVNLGNAKIVAPFGGVITAKLAEVGQVVGAGTPVYEISNGGDLKIDAYVPDKYVADLKLGLVGQAKIEGISDLQPVVITKIEPNLDTTTHKLKIELGFSGDVPAGIRLGQFVNVELDLGEREGFLVPNRFVLSGFDGPYINTGAERIDVEMYDQIGDKVWIDYDGIEEGITILRQY